MLKITKGLDIIGMIKDLTIKAGNGITLSLKELKEEIDARTPEDTGLLVSNNDIKPVEIRGNIAIGSISNNTEYAADVEYGLPHVKYYHDANRNIIFRNGQYKGGAGNRAYARSVDEMEKDIVNNIKKSIGL